MDFSVTQTLGINSTYTSVSPLTILRDTREEGQELMLAHLFCVCSSWHSVTVLPRCRMKGERDQN